MDVVIKGLLLNLLFLLFFLVFIPLVLEETKFSARQKKFITIFSACLAIIACMSFPLVIREGIIIDLRFVATIVGGLYGGILANILLWLTNILFRFTLDGIGIYSTFVISTFHLVFLIYLYPKFKRYTKYGKMLVSSVIVFFSMLSVVFIISVFFNTYLRFHIGFATTIISIISVIVIVYIKEVMRDAALMKQEAMRAEKMEIVSQLAASMSHEVRNPLTVVKGFLQLMKEKELPVKKQKEYLTLSISELERANNIISDYLSFAKPAQHELEKKAALNVKYELEKIIELIIPHANMNSVTIEKELHSLWFKGDKSAFQQSMLNIMKNCIEAMPNGGLLSINTIANREQVTIEISDTGVGMTEEEVNRIGEPYFTTKGSKGTGLGMMASIKIIESMNGTIHIESEVAKGTTFTIRLPKVDPE